jgi:hypothetical protein
MAGKGSEKTQFKPGQSGNPTGRKPASIIFREAIGDDAIKKFGKALKAMAEKGDIRAAELIMDRVVPRAKEEPIVIPGFNEAITLDDKASVIMKAVADGEINPTQGEKLINSLAARIKILESSVLIEQIEALKKAVYGENKG